MKKITILIVIFSFSLFLFSCNPKVVTKKENGADIVEASSSTSEKEIKELGKYRQRMADSQVKSAIAEAIRLDSQGKYEGNIDLSRLLEIQNTTSSQPGDNVRKEIDHDNRHSNSSHSNSNLPGFTKINGVYFYDKYDPEHRAPLSEWNAKRILRNPEGDFATYWFGKVRKLYNK